jgi:hypothetical protein
MLKYLISRDIIELIPNKSICNLVTSHSGIVVGVGRKNTKIKFIDLNKNIQLFSWHPFILKSSTKGKLYLNFPV